MLIEKPLGIAALVAHSSGMVLSLNNVILVYACRDEKSHHNGGTAGKATEQGHHDYYDENISPSKNRTMARIHSAVRFDAFACPQSPQIKFKGIACQTNILFEFNLTF